MGWQDLFENSRAGADDLPQKRLESLRHGRFFRF